MFRFLFFSVLVLLPLGRIPNLSFLQSERKTAPLSPLEVILPVLIGVYVLRMLMKKRLPFVSTRLGKTILIFIFWAVISLLASADHFKLSQGELLFSSLYLARWAVYASLFFIVEEYAWTRLQVKTILRWLAGGCLAFCLFGFFQSAFLPDFALTLYPDARRFIDYDPQGHRLVSTLLDPNIAAGYIVIFGLIALSFYVHGFRRWGILFIICVVSLVLTLSRGGAVGFLAGLVVTVTSQKIRYSRLVISGLVVVIVALAFFPILSEQIRVRQRFSLTDPSALGRIDDWQFALEIIEANLIFGIGYNTFGFISPLYGIVREGAAAFTFSGDLLLITATTGLPGLTIYTAMLIGVFTDLRRLRSDAQNTWHRAFAIGVTAATAGAIVESCFTGLLLIPQTMAVLWILWALSTRLLQLATLERSTAGSRAPIMPSSSLERPLVPSGVGAGS